MAKTRSWKNGSSKYGGVDEKVFIETEIARGRSTDEIREGMRERWEKYERFDDLVINHMIGAVRTRIVVAAEGKRKEREASVENYEERLEEREKKFFTRVFTNNEKIEAIKEAALAFYEENPEKIRPKDYKDLSVAQAIGTRDLREYKVRRAGRLDGYNAEQLEVVKIRALEIIMKRKVGLPAAEARPVEEKIEVEYEVVDDGQDLSAGEQEAGGSVEMGNQEAEGEGEE